LVTLCDVFLCVLRGYFKQNGETIGEGFCGVVGRLKGFNPKSTKVCTKVAKCLPFLGDPL
jgi:hypothetical protein